MNASELCFRIYTLWILAENNPEEKQYQDLLNKMCKDVDKDFVPQVLLKKVEWAGVNVHMPDVLLLLIEIWTNGNPGLSQLILKEILQTCNLKDKNTRYTITTKDINNTYPNGFPFLDTKEIYDEYSIKWDSQKQDGMNLCDTREWWQEVYK